MANPVWSFLGNLILPITKLIDDMHTSDEEKLAIKSEMFAIQQQITVKVLDYEQQLLNAQTSIVKAEAQGQSWMQRNWRPITMLTFLVLVVFDSFGLLVFRLSAEAWTLLQLGLTGYVVGRSAEKTLPSIVSALKGEK
ncbi:MAG: 3TM-type holin [Pseudomonadota bacterium]